MKRLIALMLAVGMVLSLAACGSSSDDTSEDTEETEETEEESEEESEETEETETEEAEEEEETEETEEEESSDTEEEEEEDEDPVYGGTINAYYFNEFNTVYDVSCQGYYISFIMDCLWNIDWDGDRDENDYTTDYVSGDCMEGQLAESWEIADDYSSMTVTIRDDVYFQDKVAAGFDEEYDIYGGRQVTAEDIKYSYDRLLGLDGVEQVTFDQVDWETTLSMLDSVEVVDDYTVTFYFNTSNEVSVDSFMCSFVGICGEEWDELTEDQQTDWQYACGTGPFILTDYVTDNTMTFTKNENYWATDEDGNQLPYVDEVNLIYMTDTATILASFISGELDMVSGIATIFDSDEIEQLTAALEDDEYDRYVYTAEYQSLALKQVEENEALLNLTVREAMQYAIDVAAISEYAGYTYDSTEQMLSGVFASGSDFCDIDSWSDELIESYTTYDPELAQEMLEEAGYADGFTLEIALGSEVDTDYFTVAGEYLADVGIDTTFDIITVMSEAMQVGTDETDPRCVAFCLSMSSLSKLNLSLTTLDGVHADNDELDSMFDAILAAETAEEQIELAKEFDQAYMEQHYLLYVTYNRVDNRWCRSRVHGYSGENLGANTNFGYTLARCWVDDAE